MGFFGNFLLKNGAVGGTAKVSSELYNLNALGNIVSHEENISMILDRRVTHSLGNKDNLIKGSIIENIRESCNDDLPFLVFLISLYETSQFRNNFSKTPDVAKTTLEVIYEVIDSKAPNSIRLTKDEFIDKAIMYYNFHIILIKQLDSINAFR